MVKFAVQVLQPGNQASGFPETASSQEESAIKEAFRIPAELKPQEKEPFPRLTKMPRNAII